MTKRNPKTGRNRTLTPEEAEKLINPYGTDIFGPRKGGSVFQTLEASEARKFIRTCAKVVLEPQREVPGGYQIVLYTGKKVVGYLKGSAQEAEAYISGERTFPKPKPKPPKPKPKPKRPEKVKEIQERLETRGPKPKVSKPKPQPPKPKPKPQPPKPKVSKPKPPKPRVSKPKPKVSKPKPKVSKPKPKNISLNDLFDL